jgi:N6-adenosine-specific RNA methylase IME4
MSDTFRDLDALLRTGRKFGAILADPPWSFATYSDKGKGRSAERHYRCMSLDDIKGLPIAELAAPDCVLFLYQHHGAGRSRCNSRMGLYL